MGIVNTSHAHFCPVAPLFPPLAPPFVYSDGGRAGNGRIIVALFSGLPAGGEGRRGKEGKGGEERGSEKWKGWRGWGGATFLPKIDFCAGGEYLNN